MHHRKIKGYGWRPDTPDRRDYTLNFKRVVSPGKIPVKLDQRETGFFPTVFDQGALGACTGNGWAGAIAYMMRSQKLPDLGPANIPSRLMIYYGEREVEGTIGFDSGAEIRDGIKVLTERGVCDESEWPYDISKFTERPPDACYSDAAKHLVKQYGRIPQNENDLRATLTAGYPVVFGFTVYQSFESGDVAKSGTVPMPKPDETVLGGHCLSGDTLIPLLDGTDVAIKDLADGVRGREFWVYSATAEGSVVPGRAYAARLTGRDQRTVCVTLDDGSSFTCTPDHRVLLRDGSYCAAGELRSGASLMPLYRRFTSQLPGYEQLYQPVRRAWQYTHRMVKAHVVGGRYDGVVHHADFNKRNNTPENLIAMSWDEHTRLHAEQIDLLTKEAQSDRGRERSRQLMRKLWDDPVWAQAQRERLAASAAERGRNSPGLASMDRERLRSMCAENGRKQRGRKHSPEHTAKILEKKRELAKTDPAYALRRRENAVRNLEGFNAEYAAGKRPLTDAQLAARRRNVKIAHSTRMAKYQDHNNHKVVSVTEGEPQDVYDLTVDEHHNFALSSGVFVHNCVVLCGFDFSLAAPIWICRNSWGAGWGEGGYFTMPKQYLLDPDLSSDFWAAELVA